MYEEEETSPAPNNMLYALLRYKWHIAVASPVLMAVALGVVLLLPSVYMSDALIVVETQQIPQELVSTTITNKRAEQIEMIKQRVMTRSNLLNIIEKYPHFQTEGASPTAKSRALSALRQNIMVKVISSGPRSKREAIAFRLSYVSSSPSVALGVTNDLVTLFLAENVSTRRERASETTQFLQSEADKLKRQLEVSERAVSEYKLANKDALPEHLSLYNSMLASHTSKLEVLIRDIRVAKERLQLFRAQANGESKADGEAVLGQPLNPRLNDLKQEYSRLSLLYQPAHPDLLTLKKQIEDLENSGVTASGNKQGGDYLGLTADLDVQLAGLRSELSSMEEEKKRAEEKIAELEGRIMRIPQVETEMIALSRDFDTKSQQYNTLVSKVLNASMAESLELGGKAETFSLLEPPRLPTKPASPNRLLLMLVGMAGSLGMPIAIVLLLGLLDKTIRTPEALEAVTRSSALIEIPYIRTQQESKVMRLKLIKGLLVATSALLVGLALAHFLVMPIGELFPRIIERLGIV